MPPVPPSQPCFIIFQSPIKKNDRSEVCEASFSTTGPGPIVPICSLSLQDFRDRSSNAWRKLCRFVPSSPEKQSSTTGVGGSTSSTIVAALCHQSVVCPAGRCRLRRGCASRASSPNIRPGKKKKMERYLIKRPSNINPTSTTTNIESSTPTNINPSDSTTTESSTPNEPRAAPRYNSAVPELIDLDKLPRDPSKRKRMADYHPNQRDQIRRKYLTWGPHQPRGFKFPYKLIGKKNKSKRRFNPDWFDQYANWIEYSEKTDEAYCLCCYLFRNNVKDNHHGHDAFVVEGWNTWKNSERLVTHVAFTNGLSKALQRKYKDIVNAISDVESTKRELEKLRTNEGWNSLMEKVSRFCEKHDISILDMKSDYVNPKKPRQKTGINNEHQYRVDCFFAVLDMLGKEFHDIFNEVNSELLRCMSALSPSDIFGQFDKEKLVKLAKFYPDDFNHKEMMGETWMVDGEAMVTMMAMISSNSSSRQGARTEFLVLFHGI
uniref:Uncharacterized protein n=1 Tax=Avena sativa TaxID=4498 RepID=A0ACD5UQE5_AVESA